MSEEEKETIEDCKELVQELKQHKDKDFIGRLYYKSKPVEDILSVLLNLIEKQQKELNNLKEIEQSHQEENGLLRQELDMQIEHNKELETTLKQTQDSWFEDTQKLEQEKMTICKKCKWLWGYNKKYFCNASGDGKFGEGNTAFSKNKKECKYYEEGRNVRYWKSKSNKYR